MGLPVVLVYVVPGDLVTDVQVCPYPMDVSTTLCHTVPLETSILPDVLGAINVGVDVPAPTSRLLAVRVARPVPPPTTGNPVQLVNVPLAGVPNAGVTSVADVIVGLVPNTTAPLPVEVVTPVPPFTTGNVPLATPT
jgi:hypothetical protein